MSLESHATCMPGPWAERALSPREVPGTLPPPGTGWSRAGAGLLGWGQVCVIEARVASDVTASLDALLGELAAAGPWLGGWAFDLEQPPAGVWADFPLLRFVVPAVVLRWGGSAATLSWQSGAEDLAVEIQRAWDSPHAGGSPPRSTWALGNRAHWDALHARALDEVASGRLGKVVLARSVPGRSSATPLGAFLALARGNPGSRAFLFQCGAGTFVGASPEILCHVEGDRLETEALAGTAPVAEAEGLRASDKDLREHAHVVESIRDALEGRVSGLTVPTSPDLVRLPRLAHLRTPIRARLPDRSQLPGIVRALHPTPAVNGVPRSAARAFLRVEEGLSRGWFTGVVGCVEGESVELRVALRCALLHGDGAAELFAGAGVVAGSTSDGEWTETARKLQTAKAALGQETVGNV